MIRTGPADQLEKDEALVITWGAHRGKALSDIPSNYLKWLAENARQESICVAAERVWKWREKYQEHV